MRLLMQPSSLANVSPLHFPDEDFSCAVKSLKNGDPSQAQRLVEKFGGEHGARTAAESVSKGLTQWCKVEHLRRESRVMRFAANHRVISMAKRLVKLESELKELSAEW
jgi:hypothetical protein